jgi:hypothetical protein
MVNLICRGCHLAFQNGHNHQKKQKKQNYPQNVYEFGSKCAHNLDLHFAIPLYQLHIHFQRGKNESTQTDRFVLSYPRKRVSINSHTTVDSCLRRNDNL